MNMDHWTIFKDSAALILTGSAALIAAVGYKRNANTRRAEFLCDLHKSFFEESTYKEVRRVLDESPEKSAARCAEFVTEEPEAFTDFLNYFELVAYLHKRGNLSTEDVKALLGYYLDLLKNNQGIRDYIRDRKHGFEELNGLLDII
jgi:hypothetical protein